MSSHSPEDVAAEFLIDGSWVDTYGGEDLAARIRGQDSVRITRGQSDQQSSASPVSVVFTLNNRDGLFTDDNPNSPLFGLFGLGTQARFGIKDSSGTWDEYLRMTDTAVNTSIDKTWTADKASLDITGDIDIRVELSTDYTRNRRMPILAKYVTTGNNRSYALFWDADGQLSLLTSPDGTLGAALTNISGVALAENTGRIAIRVTLDVNNGAAGHDYKWYTSDSVDGTWTLISSGTVAGTTSIFSGNSALEIGSGNNGNPIFTDSYTFSGKIWAAQIYSGINGTLVADFRPAGEGIEATSWVDSCASPNTWTINGDDSRLASDRIRAAGEFISIPDDWDLTGADVYTPCVLNGILNRYMSSTAALGSAIYRFRRNYPNMTGYWPCEDASGATTTASALPGGRAGTFNQCTFGSVTGLDGSTGAITMTNAPNASYIRMAATITGGDVGATGWAFYLNLASLPSSSTVLASFYSRGGTAVRWDFAVGSISYKFTAYDKDNNVLDTSDVGFGTGASPLDTWVGMSLYLTQESGNVRWNTSWHAVGTEIFYTHALGGETYAGVTGQFSIVNFDTPDAAFAGAQIAHVQIGNTDLLMAGFATAASSKGWAGETVMERMRRLADEEDIFFEKLGRADLTPVMGPQTSDTLFANLTAAQAVDGGILTEPRDKVGFLYIARHYLGNRRGLTYEYGSSHLADVPRPTRDNRNVVNDFTANRPSGSSFRYEVTDPLLLNVSDPPEGAGRVERSGSFSVQTDSQLPSVAQLQTATGAWRERRIPNLTVELNRPEIYSDTLLFGDTLAWDVGRPVSITDLADAPTPPDDMHMVGFGYTETFNGFLWSIVGNTGPAGPYWTPILGDESEKSDPRLDATDLLHSVVNGDHTSGDTTIAVKTDATYPTKFWVDSTNYPDEIGGGVTFNIKIAGEVMTVSEITAPSLVSGFYEQTFTVTRSVNTIVKAIADGTPVFLAEPSFLGAS